MLVSCAPLFCATSNVHQCTFSCIPGMRYSWHMYTDEFLRSEMWKYLYAISYTCTVGHDIRIIMGL